MADTEYGIEGGGQGVAGGTSPRANEDKLLSSQAYPEAYVGGEQAPGMCNGTYAKACADQSSTNQAELVGSQFLFGDGSDGDVTIDADTTLTRNMYYNNLIVNAGITLNTAGYAIYVKGVLQLEGIIACNGNAGADGAAGVGGAGGAQPFSDTAYMAAFAPRMGKGGAGSTPASAGATNGASQSPAAPIIDVPLPGYLLARSLPFTWYTGGGGVGGSGHGYNSSAKLGEIPEAHLCGAAGGDGGAATGAATSGLAAGGGGGGGGGIVMAYVFILAGSGVFHAKGGNGGSGEVSGRYTGGNGGGGGGGAIVVFYRDATYFTIPDLSTTPPPDNCLGGLAGTGGAGGTQGETGLQVYISC